MKQSFQFFRLEFNRLTEQILGIKNTSFYNDESVKETLKNCIVKGKLDDILELSNIHYTDGSLGENSFIHFTLSKKDGISDGKFLKGIKLFNLKSKI